MSEYIDQDVSVVIPCRNEADSLRSLLPRVKQAIPGAEILVVDDGSSDASVGVCAAHEVRCLRHPYGKGNGAAIKTGARAAAGTLLVFMDADGQHDPDDIPRLLELIDRGYDLAVAARSPDAHASWQRAIANRGFNRLASLMTGYHIPDLTSGFRAVRADFFRKILYLLPNGFSYPTTSTMAFYRSGFSVGFIPTEPRGRIGSSHINPLKDGLRFLVIILKIGTLFSPMRLFLPIAALLFFSGCGYYVYTYVMYGRLTNMVAVLFLSSLLVLLIGFVSEQIAALHYRTMDLRPETGREGRRSNHVARDSTE